MTWQWLIDFFKVYYSSLLKIIFIGNKWFFKKYILVQRILLEKNFRLNFPYSVHITVMHSLYSSKIHNFMGKTKFKKFYLCKKKLWYNSSGVIHFFEKDQFDFRLLCESTKWALSLAFPNVHTITLFVGEIKFELLCA